MYLTAKHALVGRTVRYLLFDLGNTLWKGIDPVKYDAIEQKTNDYAVTVLHQLLAPMPLPSSDTKVLGQRLREMVSQQLRDALRNNPEVEPDAALITNNALYRLGFPPVDRTVGLKVFEALNIRIPQRRSLDDDALSTLNTLKARGFSLGVVTNRHWGGDTFQEDLHTMGICPVIDLKHMAISADVGLRKPNPELFQHTLRTLNAVPEETVMVGDSIAADIRGAKMLGMLAVWKPKPRLWAEARSTVNLRFNEEANPDDQEQPDHYTEHNAGTYELRAAVASHNRTKWRANRYYAGVEGYFLAYVSRHSKKLNILPGDAQPDVIIEHLSDLLDVFTQAGTQ